jgi:hypothetical protein
MHARLAAPGRPIIVDARYCIPAVATCAHSSGRGSPLSYSFVEISDAGVGWPAAELPTADECAD